jgi:hypothetical protein
MAQNIPPRASQVVREMLVALVWLMTFQFYPRLNIGVPRQSFYKRRKYPNINKSAVIYIAIQEINVSYPT